jgi:hypothetical protein
MECMEKFDVEAVVKRSVGRPRRRWEDIKIKPLKIRWTEQGS